MSQTSIGKKQSSPREQAGPLNEAGQTELADHERVALIEGLRRPDSYPLSVRSGIQFSNADPDAVELHETHISWVFLVGDHAYKLKKPVRNEFLDYSTLEKRKHFCEEELRLDRRYAADLYLDVVPITLCNGKPQMEGEGDPVEYAVKMRRFPNDALLSERIESGTLSTEEVFLLAEKIAEFHQSAERLKTRPAEDPLGSIELIYENAADNFAPIEGVVTGDAARTVRVLAEWTRDYFEDHRQLFSQRLHNGFIRECHGDMHLANIVHWNGKLIPFDGIEFNDSFRWIDVINDAAFVAMDFAARERLDLCRSYINAYLEHTGDHASLAVLRWYLVYRALVRAKVAAIRSGQPDQSDGEKAAAIDDCDRHVELAYRFSLHDEAGLWITHGVSGSGKTTISDLVVQSKGAIRLRSDIERKRHFGMSPTDRPSEEQKAELYGEGATHATYARLRRMARCILRAGYPVVIDATFLRESQRQMFRSLAGREGATFGILECHACEQTLRQRIADRMAHGGDASDADLAVLEHQLATAEPLTEAEKEYVFDIPDPASMINAMK